MTRKSSAQTPSLFARLKAATRYTITRAAPQTWFGPQQPVEPQAPPQVKGRQFDYPFGVDLDYSPRSSSGGGVSFAELRALADALPLLRAVIETLKGQIAGLSHSVRPRLGRSSPAASASAEETAAFLASFNERRIPFLQALVADAVAKGAELKTGAGASATQAISWSRPCSPMCRRRRAS